jgi:NADH pyrophosphatase NudC (nudix superfamily)
MSRGFGGLSTNTMYFSSSVGNNTLTGSLSTPISASASSAPAPKLKSVKKEKSLETGRVEQGSHSSQSFQTVNKKFYYYTTNTVELQIKPVSQMYVDVKDITNMNKYCPKCGRKTKQSDNFCAGCGNRF